MKYCDYKMKLQFKNKQKHLGKQVELHKRYLLEPKDSVFVEKEKTREVY